MNKNMLTALVLIALSVIVMIMNRGDVPLNILGLHIRAMFSFVILGFVGVGVAIGVLLK